MADLKTKFEKQRTQGLLGSSNDELRLRIHGPKREGQLVVVRVPKCTIGSADSCSLPLQGPGIEPVHCIILRGERGAVVRCVAPGTTLNGMPIQDAAMFAGDRLRIGPYELEVLPTIDNVKDRKSPPNEQPASTSKARGPASDGNQQSRMDPPSLGDLASMIEDRIISIEGQLTELQQHGGQPANYEPKSEEIKLAQEAIASLSRQLDCERERNEATFEALVAERDRLASELAGATRTASDLVRELEQVRSEQVENDAASELFSQHMAEASNENAQRIVEASNDNAQRIVEASNDNAQRIVEASNDNAQRIDEASEVHARRIVEASNDNAQRIDEASNENAQRITEASEVHARRIDEFSEEHAQRIAEVSEEHAQRIAEVSTEVDRLAKRITETEQHHQQASDRWQASNDNLEQRLTDGVSQLTQLEQELEVVRRNQVETEAQRQLQGSQSEEIQESVRALKEQLSEQQSQQDTLQANWATEHEQLHEKFRQLEELHRQAVTQQAQAPSSTVSSPQAPAATVTPDLSGEQTEPRGADTLTAADLDDNSRPEPDVSREPLHLDDDNPGEQQQQKSLSRLDQLRASRVVAEMQTNGETTHEPRSYDAFNDIEEKIREQPPTNDELGSDPSHDRDTDLEITNQAMNLDGQVGGEDQPVDAATQPGISDRDRMFDLLNAPNAGLAEESTVASPQVGTESPHPGGDLPADDRPAPDASALSAGPFDAPNATNMPSAVDEEAPAPVSGTPVSVADTLTQMGQPDPVEQETPVARETVENEPIQDLDAQPKNDTVGEDDDSIEAYMNQLLARVRGGDESTQESPGATKPAKEANGSKTCEVPDDPVNKTDGSVLSELVARSEAPEHTDKISAMRDLANDTTRSAIATYDQRSGSKFVFGKLVAAGIGVSAAVLSTMYLEDSPMVRIFGIGFGLSSAAVWTWQAVVLKQRSLVNADTPTSPSDDADPETPATDESQLAATVESDPSASDDADALYV